MPASSGLRALTAAACAAVACAAVTLPSVAASAAPARPAPARQAAVVPASGGRSGPAITLASNIQLLSADAATSPSGTTYIGWIGDSGSGRVIDLCVLPGGKHSCQGGIQHTPSLGDSSAQGLRVLISKRGQVTLVWMHDDDASESGSEGSEIATATVSNGQLSAAADRATAPSFGVMYDAGLDAQGNIWVVDGADDANSIQIRPGLSQAYATVHTPYDVGVARIALSGGTAVVAIEKAGAITTPVDYAVHGHGWSGFRAVPRTWSGGTMAIATTGPGIRLVTSTNDSSYHPVVSRFSGGSFGRPQLTGDKNNCSPSGNDLYADASGRMADVAPECETLTVANLTDTLHASIFRFASGGTLAGAPPQIATTPRGRGWVIWSIESKTGDKLQAVPVVLADRDVSRTRKMAGDTAKVTGPATCLPPEDAAVRASGSAAKHWHVASARLTLNGSGQGTTLHGASLTPGKSYTLKAAVTFANGGGGRRTVTAAYTFRSCPNP